MYFKTYSPLIVAQPSWKVAPHSVKSHHHGGPCGSTLVRKEQEQASPAEVTEKDEQFRISMDVPGVKAKDLEVTMKDDGVLQISGNRKGRSQFIKNFLLEDNNKSIDTTNIKANLADGVLVVTAPKKAKEEPQPQTITVMTEAHDQKATSEDNKELAVKTFPRYGCEVMESSDEFRLAVDVPGVKASSLNVEFHDGLLRLSGQRQGRSKFYKNFAMDGQRIDTSQFQANLADGVLVVSAPKKATPEAQKITVTEGSHEEEAETTEQEQQEESDVITKQKEPDVVVETVSPEEEEDDDHSADAMEKGVPAVDE